MIWVWIYVLIGCVTAVVVAWLATDEDTIKQVRAGVDISDKGLAFGQMASILILGTLWPLFIIGTVWMAARDRRGDAE